MKKNLYLFVLCAILFCHTNIYAVKIKPFKTQQEAELYMNLASTILEKPVDNRWFRLGASSLLDELLHPQGKK